MMDHLKWALMGALVAGLLLAGWMANSWRTRAAEAQSLKRELRHEVERRIFADAKRLAKEQEIEALKVALSDRLEAAKETVVRYVKTNPDCDLPEPVAGQLQHLRAGRELPAAAAQPASAR